MASTNPLIYPSPARNQLPGQSVEMPDSFSIELRSLLTGLLQRDVHKRLGCRGRGAEEIKSHPFFRGIDWRVVFLLRLVPPLIPARGEVNAADAFDIGSFDDEDTKHIKLTEADQELYRNFPVVVSERWQHEIAETIFDYINHEADKAEMKRKNKHKLGYQEEEQSDCILHGYIKRLGGTFTATWLTRYVRLYPNRLELWSDSGKQPELIFMDQIEEVCNDYVQIKNEQCIVIKLYNHSKYVFTNSDEIGLKEWHVSLKAAHKESLDMMTTMAEKATKIYGTEIPVKHMGKRRQQLQQEANNNSAIASFEQKIIQKELHQASSTSASASAKLADGSPATTTKAAAAAKQQPAARGAAAASARQTATSGAGEASPLASGGGGAAGVHKHHRGHHQHRTHHHMRHHHHEHLTGGVVVGPAGARSHTHHHHHHHGHRSGARQQQQQQQSGAGSGSADSKRRPPEAARAQAKPLEEGLASAGPEVDLSPPSESQLSKKPVATTDPPPTQPPPVDQTSAQPQAEPQKPEVAESASVEAALEPEDQDEGSEKAQVATKTARNSSTSILSGTSSISSGNGAAGARESNAAATTLDGATSSSGSCSSSVNSSEASDEANEDLQPVQVPGQDSSTSSVAPSAVAKKEPRPVIAPKQLPPNYVATSGKQTPIAAHAKDEQQKQRQLDEPPRIRLAVSLENVSEQQEVLKDPSKRITSDNKQREQDLVAQYEKLNVSGRIGSSSSIEELENV